MWRMYCEEVNIPSGKFELCTDAVGGDGRWGSSGLSGERQEQGVPPVKLSSFQL